MKIDKPGIYRGVAEPDYRNDPCPEPSLTQSLVKVLIERAPKHAWTQNPRLNPQFEDDDDTKFDVGNVAHRLILGRGKDYEVIQFDDWRTKAAKEARENAAANSKIAILEKDFTRACDMADAARKQLAKHEDRDAFTDGDAEVMIAWQENGIWFRSLIDWLHTDLRTIDDYKSSGMSMAPHVIGIRAETAGWHVQAAFIERGLDVLDPAGAGRRRFRFIGQETDEPHALTSMHMNEYWLTMGRKKVEAGIALWLPAIKNNYWRDYGTAAVVPDYPSYKEKAWLERELAGDFEPQNDTKMVMAG
jgi:hypothetical protein